jgi:hypothetical protein
MDWHYGTNIVKNILQKSISENKYDSFVSAYDKGNIISIYQEWSEEVTTSVGEEDMRQLIFLVK